MDLVLESRKALLSGLFAAIAYLVPLVDDGLLWSEILQAVVAFGVAAGVTWAVPNKHYVRVAPKQNVGDDG
jgi:hypothetical protein